MKNISTGHIISIGLAIFSMLFGAGNLMYPLEVGASSGTYNLIGMIGFAITAVCLPIAGLIGMILFDGDYDAFFSRLGILPGKIVICSSIFIVGPLIAIPRIVTVSHTMIAPFLQFAGLHEINIYTSFIFSALFLGFTFLASFRENKIVDVLGYVISPLLLSALVTIIIMGLLKAETVVPATMAPWPTFTTNFKRGYETLDLLGTIFFSSVVIHILKNTIGGMVGYSQHALALIGFKAGTIGVALLGLIYTGMSLLGMFHSGGLDAANSGELFRTIVFNIGGESGSLLLATTVLMACFSTAIALAAIVAEYIQVTICKKKIGYISALSLALLSCMPLSIFGLSYVLQLTSGPLVYIGYPVIIATTFCNIAYKLVGFTPIKIPVLLTFILATVSYLW